MDLDASPHNANKSTAAHSVLQARQEKKMFGLFVSYSECHLFYHCCSSLWSPEQNRMIPPLGTVLLASVCQAATAQKASLVVLFLF